MRILGIPSRKPRKLQRVRFKSSFAVYLRLKFRDRSSDASIARLNLNPIKLIDLACGMAGQAVFIGFQALDFGMGGLCFCWLMAVGARIFDIGGGVTSFAFLLLAFFAAMLQREGMEAQRRWQPGDGGVTADAVLAKRVIVNIWLFVA